MDWLQSVAGSVKGVVAIDGKTLRGSGDGERGPLHLVSAWASQSSTLLGQVQTDQKSNEITAIPQLLKLLSIEGCIVTIDAMGCQKAITKSITEAKADYVLCLKGNHSHLHSMVAKWFASEESQAPTHERSHSVEHAETNNHGRIETRQCTLMGVPQHLLRATKSWTNLQTIAMVQRTRQVGDKTSEETHYYISSLPLSAGAASVAHAIRSHWAIENQLHWSLDVSFKEDASQVRKDNGPANLACLRRIALTQLKKENTLKVGIKNKRLRAGWDCSYMEQVLSLNTLLA
jgi:predicted transposase YbfD/YdcC